MLPFITALKSLKTLDLSIKLKVSDTSIFDTNIESHHHFLDEETGELTDISDNEINLLKLPDVPYGYIKKGVDVIIKIKKNI